MYTAIIVCDIGRFQALVGLRTTVLRQETVRVGVGTPDGTQAGGFRGHHVDAVAIISVHGGDARPDEFHHFVFHIPFLEDCADDCQRDVVRADARLRFACQINRDDARISHVIGVVKQLFNQFASAFADGHRPQRTVAGMTVRSEDHFAAAGHHLAHVLVDNCQMRRNVDAAIFFGRRQAEHMVIAVNGTADRAQ